MDGEQTRPVAGTGGRRSTFRPPARRGYGSGVRYRDSVWSVLLLSAEGGTRSGSRGEGWGVTGSQVHKEYPPVPQWSRPETGRGDPAHDSTCTSTTGETPDGLLHPSAQWGAPSPWWTHPGPVSRVSLRGSDWCRGRPGPHRRRCRLWACDSGRSWESGGGNRHPNSYLEGDVEFRPRRRESTPFVPPSTYPSGGVRHLGRSRGPGVDLPHPTSVVEASGHQVGFKVEVGRGQRTDTRPRPEETLPRGLPDNCRGP